ncbi:hypothetical protein P4220_02285 [Pseudomonas aeruginosa]|nr:hypothetical protein [Pseudomonas aeruginosa]MDF5914081.1 hypothetical protein [Pseudomonas aeruginosa]
MPVIGTLTITTPVTISATAPLAMELNEALAAARLRKVKGRSSRIALLHQNNAPR